MTATVDTEVCVVGGGPAGLTLALLLLRSGVTVTVLERSRSLERAYRGEILQPGGQSLLDELGVLAPARARGCVEHSRFQVVDRGRPVLDADYRRLPGAYDCLLALPQRHLLVELQAACAALPGFDHRTGTRLSALLDGGDRVAGAVGTGPDGEVRVRARAVVGADGRYSKTRALAGLDYRRVEAFDSDVLWFRLTDDGRRADAVQVVRAGGSAVLVHGTYPDQVQLGWTLPHRGYAEVAAGGIGPVRAAVARAAPAYADLVGTGLRGLGDLSLLDVFAGRAPRWSVPGLVLLGDAAHTHGPIGAQGINLAVQDAVVLHPLLLAALRGGTTALDRFEPTRGPAVDAVTRLQRRQSRAMLSGGRVAAVVRPLAGRLITHSPAMPVLLRRIAGADGRIRIRTDLFRPEHRAQPEGVST